MVTVKEHLEPAGSGPLSTHIPADISTALDNAVTGAAGTDLELDCTVVGGNPAPKLTWYVAGTEVASTLAQEDRKQGTSGLIMVLSACLLTITLTLGKLYFYSLSIQ